MNIPDEVIDAATAEVLDKPCASLPSLIEYGSKDPEDVKDARLTVVRASQVIAEWARREALRDVLYELRAIPCWDDGNGNHGFDLDGLNPRQAVLDTVRALAEEEQGDTSACATCGRPSTYRLGMPEPSWCNEHGPIPTQAGDAL